MKKALLVPIAILTAILVLSLWNGAGGATKFTARA